MLMAMVKSELASATDAEAEMCYCEGMWRASDCSHSTAETEVTALSSGAREHLGFQGGIISNYQISRLWPWMARTVLSSHHRVASLSGFVGLRKLGR